MLGMGHTVGLKKLTADILNVGMDKTEQLADWSRRPLTPSQVSCLSLSCHCCVSRSRVTAVSLVLVSLLCIFVVMFVSPPVLLLRVSVIVVSLLRVSNLLLVCV